MTLTKMTEPGGVVTTYKYDAVGNLVEEQEGSTTTTYSYDADDRLWDITVGAAGMRYGYDNNGNRFWAYDKATGANTSFSYDYENRMTARGTCQYTYAPSGERVSSSCSAPTYHGYDSLAAGGLSDAVAEYNATGARQARYTHGPGADEPVEQLRGGSYYTYQKDGLGSVSKITDASQNTVNSYMYSPWGDTSSSGSLPNQFRYTGREADSGSQLYHYRARVYDPEARRFLQKDPAGTVSGSNSYSYVNDNPTNSVDPSGLSPQWLPIPCGLTWNWWGPSLKWLHIDFDMFFTTLLQFAVFYVVRGASYSALYAYVLGCVFVTKYVCFPLIISAIATGAGWIAALACLLVACGVLIVWIGTSLYRSLSCR